MRIPASSSMAALGFTYIGPDYATTLPVQEPKTVPTSSIDFSDWFKGWGMQNTVPNYQAGQTPNPATVAKRVAGADGPVGNFMKDYGAYLAIGAGVLLVVVLMRRR